MQEKSSTKTTVKAEPHVKDLSVYSDKYPNKRKPSVTEKQIKHLQTKIKRK